MSEELPAAVDGDDVSIDGRAGPLRLRVAGAGRPVVLLHSINAAASAAEVAPVHDALRIDHRVTTPDLPGFGRSDRSDRRYSIRLYTDAVHDVMEHAVAEAGGPVHAVALSLSSEFLARAVNEAPQRFASATFVTPTAFDRRSPKLRGPDGGSREVGLMAALLKGTAFGRFAFRQLSRPGVIRYFLERTFGTKAIDEDLWRYCCRTVREPGAHRAPLCFLSATLFAADARTQFEALDLPCFLGHGTRGDFADFSGADWVRDRGNWTVESYPSGAMPWFEDEGRLVADLRRFLDGVDGAQARSAVD